MLLEFLKLKKDVNNEKQNIWDIVYFVILFLLI